MQHDDSMGRGVAALGLIAVVGCSNSSDPARFDAQASPGPIDASPGAPDARAEVDAAVTPDARPTIDAALPTPDAALPVIDAALPTIDAALPTIDAPLPTIDAASPTIDAALPTIDAALPTIDAALPTIDATPPTIDAALPTPDATPPTIDATPPAPDAEPPPVDCVVVPPPEPTLTPTVPDWVVLATVGSAAIGPGASEAEVDAMLAERLAEGVSVIEVDSGLSDYLSDAEFAEQVTFLDTVATKAHALGMHAVIYFPSLEVITPDGVELEHTMYKDHPEWIQIGIDGQPNVFYGSEETWVDDNDESAWLSPNTGYRDYFLDRVRLLAATALDGIWADVPVYLETGSAWAGTEPAAAAAFTSATGYAVPTAIDFDDPAFRAWVTWRHANLAEFIDDIRLAGQSVDPTFITIIEDFPCDNRDATAVGLDGAHRLSGDHFIRVWEIDSVSNTRAMQDANYEDFASKLAMNKWALAMERGNPTWAFSYGYQPLDAGLTLAAAVATGVVPFEANTPHMTESVDSAFRARWFAFVRAHADELLGLRRYADVGIWYSTPTRDFADTTWWGMYITTTNPTADEDWWSDYAGDSAIAKPHLGGWRGAAHVLTQLGIGYEVVPEPGDPTAQLAELDLLWLPSVAAMSDASAAAIESFVLAGGVAIATGALPGTLDETGAPRAVPALADLFGAGGGSPVTTVYGAGLAIYRPDLRGAQMYELAGGDAAGARAQTAAIEALLRAHLPDVVRFTGGPGIHVELARSTPTRHYLYAVNFTGLQVPVVQQLVALPLTYRPPPGYAVVAATAYTPDPAGQTGSVPVSPTGDGAYQLTVTVDQFAMLALDLAPLGELCP